MRSKVVDGACTAAALGAWVTGRWPRPGLSRLDFGTFLFSLFWFIRYPVYKNCSGCLKANPVVSSPFMTWEFPNIGDPNIAPEIVGSSL